MDFIPGPHHRVFKNNDRVKKFVLEEVEAHKPTMDPSSPRDFIDCFLMKMDQVSKLCKLELHFTSSLLSFDAYIEK